MIKANEYHKYIFFPLALFYWGIVFWRNLFYNLNFFVIQKISCKVISIGNISVGGTGKTPTVIYLASLLVKLGIKVSILSRGYGRDTKGLLLVSSGEGTLVNNWKHCGDESYMMAKKLNNVPILVDENRRRGSLYLVKKFKPEIIIMDDGFQHRALGRDLDIVLINGGDRVNDHRLLPYGILREPWNNIKRADVIVVTKKKPDPLLQRKLKETSLPIFETRVTPIIRYSSPTSTKKVMGNDNVYLASGLGNPEFFRTTVEHMGFNVCGVKNFPDHYFYKKKDLLSIEKKAKDKGASHILTTEKDWLKIKELGPTFPFGIVDMKIRILNEETLLQMIGLTSYLDLSHSPSEDHAYES